MTNAVSRSMLIVGGPSTGKTAYGAQLLLRSRGDVALQRRAAPTSLAPFEKAIDRLTRGLAPEHTGTSTNVEMRLPVTGPSGDLVDLVWPDYGGEQIQQLLAKRRIPDTWTARVPSADGWMVFVRLGPAGPQEDIISRPPATISPSGDPERQGDEQVPLDWSDDAMLVELLQILLFIRGVGTLRRTRLPPLIVALSCCDELTELSGAAGRASRPRDVLAHRLPLSEQFLDATWKAGAWAVLGVSAQGRALDMNESDAAYQQSGPDRFGYVVLEDGTISSDLTVPVVEIISRWS
jgi:hypothetical protein